MSDDLLPILIVGAERSGTNLLRALLSTHSKIASPPPAGIIDALGRIQSRYFPSGRPAYLSELIDAVVALTKTHLHPWDIDLDSKAIKAKVKDASLWGVFAAVNEIYAEAHGRACWCSKEPGLFNHIPEIAKQLPNARFLYLVRDGRDVALSLLRGHLHFFHVYFAAEYWAAVQRSCLSALADPALSARMFLLRYESLITSPEDVMRDLMHFNGLEFERPQMQYYRNEKVLDYSKRSRFWKNLSRPIDEKNTGMYRHHLGAKNIEIFESVAWVEMEALEYPVDSTHRKTLTHFDLQLYRVSALLRQKFWNMDPRPEGFRIRARVKATRKIISRAPAS